MGIGIRSATGKEGWIGFWELRKESKGSGSSNDVGIQESLVPLPATIDQSSNWTGSVKYKKSPGSQAAEDPEKKSKSEACGGKLWSPLEAVCPRGFESVDSLCRSPEHALCVLWACAHDESGADHDCIVSYGPGRPVC